MADLRQRERAALKQNSYKWSAAREEGNVATIGVFAVIQNERGQVLCVRHAYGDQRWTLPGGGVESGESPETAIAREVMEETSYCLETFELVGVYVAPWKDDYVLCFRGTVGERGVWAPSGEIAACLWCDPADLPTPFSVRARTRLIDALAGRAGVLHVFEQASPG